jgi:site-specific recombinase XerD
MLQNWHLVFPNAVGKVHRYLGNSLEPPLSNACRAAGVSRHIRVHDLRHSYASQLKLKGVPLENIKELLGHSTITMTMRYAHIAPESQRHDVDLLDESQAPHLTGQPRPKARREREAAEVVSLTKSKKAAS